MIFQLGSRVKIKTETFIIVGVVENFNYMNYLNEQKLQTNRNLYKYNLIFLYINYFFVLKNIKVNSGSSCGFKLSMTISLI